MRQKTKNLIYYCTLLGLGTSGVFYGDRGTAINAIGTGLQISTMTFGIGYIIIKFFGSVPDIDRSEQLRKNTNRIFELEKKVGLRDE